MEAQDLRLCPPLLCYASGYCLVRGLLSHCLGAVLQVVGYASVPVVGLQFARKAETVPLGGQLCGGRSMLAARWNRGY